MIGIPELQKAVKYARTPGYLLHDLRNPDFYTTDNSAEIKKIDSAFMDSANAVGMDFVAFAGYGESPVAQELSDSMADRVLDTGNAEAIAMKMMDVYALALPLFKASMKKWLADVSEQGMLKLREYWGQHA
jgi:hypothetical protein